MKPTIKHNLNNTYHQDGTVSYWDVYRQQWDRRPADRIDDSALVSMAEYERRRIAQHACLTQSPEEQTDVRVQKTA